MTGLTPQSMGYSEKALKEKIKNPQRQVLAKGLEARLRRLEGAVKKFESWEKIMCGNRRDIINLEQKLKQKEE